MARIGSQGLVQSLIFLFLITLASAQSLYCPNNLAVYNSNLRTACVNGSTLTPISLFLSQTPQIILTTSHSILHRTRPHRYSPERRRALQPRAPSHI